MSDSDTTRPALVDFVLALADDNVVVAQRLGELISLMPELEEDIAVANLSLDHLGQARALYTYAAAVQDEGRNEDDLAMTRDERDFRNAVLVEQPNGDFGQTMARQLFVDAFQVPLWEALSASADAELGAIAAKAAKEARYHLEHSSGWVVRLGDGTDESHRRMQAGVDTMWPYVGDMFAMGPGHDALVAAGIAADMDVVRRHFDATIDAVLAEATLSLPEDPYQRLGGRVGHHTEQLGHLLTEMQWLYRSHAGAQW